MYQIGMTSAARSAPVGRETRGTARRWGRETLPHQGVTNRYPVHSMLPNSSATGNVILFLVANVFGRGFPNVWGLCTPHTWGHPNTTQLFLLIYIRLFTHCNFAVSSGIFRYLRHFCSDVNSGYYCKSIRNVLRILYGMYLFAGAGFLAAEFSAVDFNSAQCAELKNLDSVPSTYLRGGLRWVCGGYRAKPTTQTVSFERRFLYTFLFLWWVWWVLHKKST